MWDVLSLLTALILGYICFVSVGLFLIELLFPFLTKEEMAQRRKINFKKVSLRKQKTLAVTR